MANVLVDHSLTIGTTAETTYAVPTTLGGGYEWLESSKIDQDPNEIVGAGLRQGSKFDRSDRDIPGISTVKGQLDLELISKSLGKILAYSFGTGVNTQVSGALYQELFTATTSTPVMPAFPVQEGIVRADGTIDAYTSAGCVASSLEIAQPAKGPMTVKVDIIGRYKHRLRTVADGATTSASATVTSATALFGWNDIGRPISGTGIPAATTILAVASTTSITLSANATATATGLTLTIGTAYVAPTYPTTPSLYGNALPASGALVLGGTLTVPTTTALGSISGGITSVGLRSWSMQLDNGTSARPVVGGANQPTTGKRKGTITTVIEYDATTGAYLADAQASQTGIPLLLTATTTEAITTGNLATAQLSIPVAKISSGAFPAPTKGDIAATTIKWRVLDGLVASQALYFAMRTSDTAL